jgi:hypothetical protein
MADANKLIQDNTKKVEANAKAWAKLEDPLKKATEATRQAVDVQKQLNDQLKNAKTSKEFATAQKQIEGNIKAVSLAEKEAIEVQKKAQQLERERIKTATAQAKEKARVARETDKLNSLYKKESARLTELRNDAKEVAIQFGRNSDEFKEASKAVNELDEELKAIDSSLGQNQRNVGNYTDGIGEMGGSMGGAIDGFIGMTKASLAFIATPIGAVLTIIVGAFTALKNAVGRSEKATMAFAKVGAFFKGIIAGLSQAIVPLAEFLGDTFVKLLEDPKQALKDLGGIIKDNVINRFKALFILFDAGKKLLSGDFKEAAKLAADGFIQLGTGVTDATEKLKKVGATIVEVQEATIRAANATREYAKAQIEFEKIQLRMQNEAEKLRQIRDDESLSISKRIFANERLGASLDKQMSMEKALAEQNLVLAKAQLIANGETEESIQAVGDAEIKLLEIEERITGQRSEQLTERNALLKEQKEKTKEINDAILADQKENEAEVEALFEAELQAYLDAEDKKTAKAEEEAAKRKALIEEGKELAIDTAATILANSIATNALRVDDEIAKNREELNTKLADESLNEDQRAVLQAEAKKREDALKLKRAKAEKKDALFRIGINTAVAVVKTLATLGIPAGLIPAAAVAAAGLAEAAVVSAKPLPKFDKGTKSAPTGGFWAGEKRGEFMVNDGKVSYIDKPTMFGNDYAGSTIIGGAQSAQIMDQIGRQEAVNNITGYNDTVAAQMLDLAMLKLETRNQTRAIVGAINNNKPSGLDEMRKRNYDNGINKHRS